MKRFLLKSAAALFACQMALAAGTAVASAAGDGGYTCAFSFSQPLAEAARIRVGDTITLVFEGSYGTDVENLRCWTCPLVEVTAALDDEDVDFFLFGAQPKFASDVQVVVDASPGNILYRYADGAIARVDAVYEDDAWRFSTKELGAYFLTEEEYPEGALADVARLTGGTAPETAEQQG